MQTFVKKGFTLIELLVTIGILAVVAAGVVALINPGDKLRQASDAKVQSDISQLVTALQSYAAQQAGGLYPCVTGSATCPNPLGTNGLAALVPAEVQVVPAVPNGYGTSYGYLANSVTAPTAIKTYGQLQSNRNGGTPTTPRYWVWCSGAAALAKLATVPNPAYTGACQ